MRTVFPDLMVTVISLKRLPAMPKDCAKDTELYRKAIQTSQLDLVIEFNGGKRKSIANKMYATCGQLVEKCEILVFSKEAHQNCGLPF
jgi:hypothetical protein